MDLVLRRTQYCNVQPSQPMPAGRSALRGGCTLTTAYKTTALAPYKGTSCKGTLLYCSGWQHCKIGFTEPYATVHANLTSDCTRLYTLHCLQRHFRATALYPASLSRLLIMSFRGRNGALFTGSNDIPLGNKRRFGSDDAPPPPPPMEDSYGSMPPMPSRGRPAVRGKMAHAMPQDDFGLLTDDPQSSMKMAPRSASRKIAGAL